MLYVSNPSRQQVVFYYRRAVTKDASAPSSVSIASGGQVELGFNWTPEETSYVITQIERAGGANAAEAHGRMGSNFTGLLYREAYVVDEGEILSAHESVMLHAEERSAMNATRGALAFDRVANGGRRSRVAAVTEVEVRQEVAPNEKASGKEVHFQLSVDPKGTTDVRGVTGLS